MDKEQLQRLSKPTVDVYTSIEEEMLVNMAKRIKKHDRLLEEDIQKWLNATLSETGNLSDDHLRIMRERSDLTEGEILKALENAGYGELRTHEEELQEGVKLGKLNEAPPLKESEVLIGILASYEAQSKRKLNMVNASMLENARQVYTNILNETVGQVMAGTKTNQQALRDTITRYADEGVPALIDRGGRKWTTEAYVNTVMRSTTNNVANEMQDARMGEYGVELVEVSSYGGARPKCANDQGKVYSIKGDHGNFPPFSSTSYGDIDGLFGVNCSHIKYPYVEGLSRKTYQPFNKKENDRIYKESQKQRYLERQIKHAKREKRMFEELGDQEGLERAKQKIRDRQANMRSFIDDTERTRRYNREQVY